MKLRYALLAGLLSSLPCGLLAGPTAWAQAEPDTHLINLADVDIATLIEDVGAITGYAFIIGPDVRARVNVTTPVPLTTREVFQLFLSTLRAYGYAAVPEGRDIYRIVPEEIAIGEGTTPGPGLNTFSTEVFHLEHLSAVEASKVIQPLLGPLGQVSASSASNVLIVVEYASALGRVRSLLKQLDEDRSVTRTVNLKTVPVADMQLILTELNGNSAGGSGPSPLSVVAAEASNSIILRGEPNHVERAVDLIAQLDVSSGLSRETRVMRLSHAEAATVLPILQELASDVSDDLAENTGRASSSSTKIALHEPSNALIINATPDVLSSLMRVADELDARRKQVLVEAIIVEVSDIAAKELGLQFLVAGQDGDVPFVSQTFSSAAPNLLALSGVLEGLGPGTGAGLMETAALASLLGVSGGTVGFTGERNGTLFNVVLNALEEDTETNILSTPSVLSLNNQTARVQVGQEIPISSGQVLGDANLNPFQTTARQEIGVILNVTPRIGDDNTIRLDLSQEVSSVAGTVGEIAPDFILNQSIVETSIIADDGELLVIGGLIQASDAINVQKVPLLGDIPGLGRLFRNEEKSRSTTNLMIFIRPTIIADKAAADAATARNYNYIRAQEIIANNGGPAIIDEFAREVLDIEPPIPPTPSLDNER
jgi:general secretion pathway protein D